VEGGRARYLEAGDLIYSVRSSTTLQKIVVATKDNNTTAVPVNINAYAAVLLCKVQDAAYCYGCSVVCVPVCWSEVHNREP